MLIAKLTQYINSILRNWENKQGKGDFLKSEKFFEVPRLCANMALAMHERYPEECSSERIYDAMLHTLVNAEKNPYLTVESQTFYTEICEIMMQTEVWLKDPRTLPACRKAFMKDAVNLLHYGSWGEFLHHFNQPCMSDIDKELELRTSTVLQGRRKWLSHTSLSMSSDDDLYSAKCPNLFCDNLQSEQAPFTVTCNHCTDALYCSVQCKYEDDDKHSKLCSKDKLIKPTSIHRNIVSLKSGACENCLTTVAEEEGLSCAKASFCSAFCADYAMRRGVHGKNCIADPEHVEHKDFDDTGHFLK